MRSIRALATAVGGAAVLAATAALGAHPWPFHGASAGNDYRGAASGPASPYIQWSYTVESGTNDGFALCDSGRIYIGTSNTNRVFALASDGSFVWSYRVAEKIWGDVCADSAEKIYAGSFDNRLYALTSAGALSWSYLTAADVTGGPKAYDGKIYFGSKDNNLYSIGSTGGLSWSYAATDDLSGITPSVTAAGGIVFGSNDNVLRVLESNGTLSWSYVEAGNADSSGIGAGGSIISGSSGGVLYSLVSTGAFSWSYKSAAMTMMRPAIRSDGSIFAGMGGQTVYGLTSGGGLSWSYLASSYGKSAAIGTDGEAYFRIDTSIARIESDGTLTWSYYVGLQSSNNPALGSDGMLYVLDGDVYAFSEPPIPTATPTVTPTVTPSPCVSPMVFKNAGGDMDIPTTVSSDAHGISVKFVGCSDGEAFASTWDNENVSTPGAAAAGQRVKLVIQHGTEAVNIPDGFVVRYKDGATWKNAYCPQSP